MRNVWKVAFSVAAVAIALAGGAPLAEAKWPMDKQMTIVVPWPAGTGPDVVARILAEGFQKKWGNTVLVENRVGASGNIGQNFVAKAAPDGYTLIVSTPGPSANNILTFKSLTYNPLTDFSFITTATEDPMVLVAGPRLKVKDFKEFAEYVKANPGKLQFAHGGLGTTAHMSQLALQDFLGTTFNMIPYKGSPQMNADLLGEQVDAAINIVSGWMEMVKAGRLRALVVIGDKRLPSLPDVPSLKELGIDFSVQPWIGFQGPKGMDKDIVDQLNKAAVDILGDPLNTKKLADIGATVRTMSPSQFEKVVREEVEKWRPIVTKYNISAE
jgi:tripartite-type tricarboxylate transporter receptor subunit TctC